MAPSSTPTRPGLASTVALYALARLALLAVIALLLVLAGVPVLVALLVGLILALPLSMVLFRGLRTRLDEALATTRERRAVEREALRARLRGDEPPPEVGAEPGAEGLSAAGPSDVAAPDQPDRGQH
jgi:Zn-dependent protease with chaperone function